MLTVSADERRCSGVNATPMSATGAGGCIILSHCNVSIPRLFVVKRARMGRACLAYWPFAPLPATAFCAKCCASKPWIES